jgi:hypothetical protein
MAARGDAAPEAAQPWAAAREQIGIDRLALSDAWMRHLDAGEAAQLRSRRPWGFIGSGLYAAVWVGLAVGHQNATSDWLGTSALIGAAAANVGFLIAQAYSDVYDQHTIVRWSTVANYAFLGAGAALSTLDHGCDYDCKLIDFSLAGLLFARALAQAAVNLVLPPVWVTQHYREYQQLSAAERPQFALDLLRAQEERHRYEGYVSVAVSAVSGVALLIVGATQARTDGTRWFGYVAGGLSIAGGVATLVELSFETPTSERLVAGELPPHPTAF